MVEHFATNFVAPVFPAFPLPKKKANNKIYRGQNLKTEFYQDPRIWKRQSTLLKLQSVAPCYQISGHVFCHPRAAWHRKANPLPSQKKMITLWPKRALTIHMPKTEVYWEKNRKCSICDDNGFDSPRLPTSPNLKSHKKICLRFFTYINRMTSGWCPRLLALIRAHSITITILLPIIKPLPRNHHYESMLKLWPRNVDWPNW